LLRALTFKFINIAAPIEQFGNLKAMKVEELIDNLKRMRSEIVTLAMISMKSITSWQRLIGEQGSQRLMIGRRNLIN